MAAPRRLRMAVCERVPPALASTGMRPAKVRWAQSRLRDGSGALGSDRAPRITQRGDAKRMSLLEKVAVVGLAIVYCPALPVMVLAGSGLLLAPLEVVGILSIATALAYLTVRGVPNLRRAKK